MPPQPLLSTLPQALQILLTIEHELLLVYPDLRHYSGGHALHHDTLYSTTHQAATSIPSPTTSNDRQITIAHSLAPLLTSLKRRHETQIRHYRAWKTLVTCGLTSASSIHRPIDQSSSVNKPAVLNLIERLSAFPGFAQNDLLEVQGWECACGTCVGRAVEREEERGDVFVQPGYWFAAAVLRGVGEGEGVEGVLGEVEKWGGFGVWDGGHRVFVPSEGEGEERVYEEERNPRRGFRDGMDELVEGSIGRLFGEEVVGEEEDDIGEYIEDVTLRQHTGVDDEDGVEHIEDIALHQQHIEIDDEDGVEHVEDIALHYHIEAHDEDDLSTIITTPPPTPEEQLVDPTLTLCPLFPPTDPCPEHCPSRRCRLRNKILNPNHSSCKYHCHTSHGAFEFERSGKQVGFWLPHGLQDEEARRRWVGTTMERVAWFEVAWKSLFGDDGRGEKVAEEVRWCVWDFERMGEGDERDG